MISVIIPAYNEEKYIEKTLKSIKKQNFKHYETIVVCNGCTDNTKDIAKRYADKVLVIKEANVMLAKNKGASVSKYKKLIFLDADTKFNDSNALYKISKYKCDISTCFFLPNNFKLRYIPFFIVKNLSNFFGTANGIIICDKEKFHKIGGFNVKRYPLENRDLIMRFKRIGNFRVVPLFVVTSMRRHDKWGLYSLLYWSKSLIFNNKERYEAVR